MHTSYLIRRKLNPQEVFSGFTTPKCFPRQIQTYLRQTGEASHSDNFQTWLDYITNTRSLSARAICFSLSLSSSHLVKHLFDQKSCYPRGLFRFHSLTNFGTSGGKHKHNSSLIFVEKNRIQVWNEAYY